MLELWQDAESVADQDGFWATAFDMEMPVQLALHAQLNPTVGKYDPDSVVFGLCAEVLGVPVPVASVTLPPTLLADTLGVE